MRRSPLPWLSTLMLLGSACEETALRGDGAAADRSLADITGAMRQADGRVDQPSSYDLAVTDGVKQGDLSGADGKIAAGYDARVLAKKPVGYWLVSAVSGTEADLSGHGHTGKYSGAGARATVALPNGEPAIDFNGKDQYLDVGDSDDFSVVTTGEITIDAWMRPSVLQFPSSQGDYVHWMGKGVNNQHEWVSRMYNLTNSAQRPNRISGYAFNLTGGLGAGSYFEDKVTVGEWIHYTLVINTKATSTNYPTGYTKIYKNGTIRDQDSLKDYAIIPKNGTAPMRIATRDFASFFQGAIAKVAVYPRELTPAEIADNHSAMMF